MAVLDLQRRSYEIGRIRMGAVVPYGDEGKVRPKALTAFRFTTTSRRAAFAIADVYGGEPGPWAARPATHWEVFSEASLLGVMVSADDAWLTQWYEMWNRGGRLRRCDSQVMVGEDGTAGPCLCPHRINEDGDRVPDPIERARLAKLNPPQACKLKTTMRLRLPDLPGEGVWRLETGSYYAATEVRDKAVVLEYARQRHLYLPAEVWIEQREEMHRGEVTKYVVPVLQILADRRQLMTGTFSTDPLAQLPPPPGETRRAITAGPVVPRLEPSGPARPRPSTAAELASEARVAVHRGQIEGIAKRAADDLRTDDMIKPDPHGEKYEPLDHFLRTLWKSLPLAPDPGAHDEGEPPPPPEPPDDEPL